jgi:hypothetical protein
MSGAPRLLAPLRLSQYDAILATFGGGESASFLSARHWRRHVETMLDFVRATGPNAPPVFISAVPLIDSIPGVWGILARRRAQQFNLQSASACEGREAAFFVPIDSLDPRAQSRMNRDAYRAWADSLSPMIALVLNRASSSSGTGI